MEAADMDRASGSTRSCSTSSAAMSPNRISADMERRSMVAGASYSSCLSSTDPENGARAEPPTPPGSPIDRPFPPAMLPPPFSMEDASSRLEARRIGGDGGRHKSETKSSGIKTTGQHGKTRKSKGGATSAARQPSDGYQVLDEACRNDDSVESDAQVFAAAAAASNFSSSSPNPQIISSDSGESSSECDWSEDEGDSSDDQSDHEVQAPRGAADGMSSDADAECLL